MTTKRNNYKRHTSKKNYKDKQINFKDTQMIQKRQLKWLHGANFNFRDLNMYKATTIDTEKSNYKETHWFKKHTNPLRAFKNTSMRLKETKKCTTKSQHD